MPNRFYAYCCGPDNHGFRARGFVLAPNKDEALRKAKVRVKRERTAVAKTINMRYRDLPALGRSRRVMVWLDTDRTSAPTTKHYVEKGRTK